MSGAAGEALGQAPELIETVGGLAGDDECPRARDPFDEAFLAQEVEGFPDDVAADPELLSEGVLVG